MFNEETTTKKAVSESEEITGYIEMFIEYLTMFINYVKTFLAQLGISLGGDEATTA